MVEMTEDMVVKREEQCGGVKQIEEDKDGDGNVGACELHVVKKEEVNKSKKI